MKAVSCFPALSAMPDKHNQRVLLRGKANEEQMQHGGTAKIVANQPASQSGRQSVRRLITYSLPLVPSLINAHNQKAAQSAQAKPLATGSQQPSAATYLSHDYRIPITCSNVVVVCATLTWDTLLHDIASNQNLMVQKASMDVRLARTKSRTQLWHQKPTNEPTRAATTTRRRGKKAYKLQHNLQAEQP